MTDLTKLEEQRRALLVRIENWSPQRLNYRPETGCWSAAEVFDHLVKTEERILEVAKRGLGKARRVGFSDRARTAFLRSVFLSERRVKVPSSAAVVLPDASPDMALVLRRWQAVRGEIALFHSQLSPAQMRRGVFRHPVGGWMALPDVLDFFSVHMVHHSFQLDRLSAESRNL